MWSKGEVILDHVRARTAQTGATAESTALQLRLSRFLGGVDLQPVSMPPSAVLIVKEMVNALSGEFGDRPTAEWEKGARQAVSDAWHAAARPAHEFVADAVGAVRFSDQAEMLACLAVDIARGEVLARWWWRAILRRLPSVTVAGVLGVQPRLMPAMFDVLSRRQQAGRVLGAVPPQTALRLLRAMADAHGVGAIGDVARGSAVLDTGSLPLPAELGAEQRALLGVGLTVHRHPAAARAAAVAAVTAPDDGIVARLAERWSATAKPSATTMEVGRSRVEPPVRHLFTLGKPMAAAAVQGGRVETPPRERGREMIEEAATWFHPPTTEDGRLSQRAVRFRLERGADNWSARVAQAEVRDKLRGLVKGLSARVESGRRSQADKSTPRRSRVWRATQMLGDAHDAPATLATTAPELAVWARHVVRPHGAGRRGGVDPILRPDRSDPDPVPLPDRGGLGRMADQLHLTDRQSDVHLADRPAPARLHSAPQPVGNSDQAVQFTQHNSPGTSDQPHHVHPLSNPMSSGKRHIPDASDQSDASNQSPVGGRSLLSRLLRAAELRLLKYSRLLIEARRQGLAQEPGRSISSHPVPGRVWRWAPAQTGASSVGELSPEHLVDTVASPAPFQQPVPAAGAGGTAKTVITSEPTSLAAAPSTPGSVVAGARRSASDERTDRPSASTVPRRFFLAERHQGVERSLHRLLSAATRARLDREARAAVRQSLLHLLAKARATWHAPSSHIGAEERSHVPPLQSSGRPTAAVAAMRRLREAMENARYRRMQPAAHEPPIPWPDDLPTGVRRRLGRELRDGMRVYFAALIQRARIHRSKAGAPAARVWRVIRQMAHPAGGVGQRSDSGAPDFLPHTAAPQIPAPPFTDPIEMNRRWPRPPLPGDSSTVSHLLVGARGYTTRVARRMLHAVWIRRHRWQPSSRSTNAIQAAKRATSAAAFLPQPPNATTGTASPASTGSVQPGHVSIPTGSSRSHEPIGFERRERLKPVWIAGHAPESLGTRLRRGAAVRRARLSRLARTAWRTKLAARMRAWIEARRIAATDGPRPTAPTLMVRLEQGVASYRRRLIRQARKVVVVRRRQLRTAAVRARAVGRQAEHAWPVNPGEQLVVDRLSPSVTRSVPLSRLRLWKRTGETQSRPGIADDSSLPGSTAVNAVQSRATVATESGSLDPLGDSTHPTSQEKTDERSIPAALPTAVQPLLPVPLSDTAGTSNSDLVPDTDYTAAPLPRSTTDAIHTPTAAPGADESVAGAPLPGTERLSNPPAAPGNDEPGSLAPLSGTEWMSNLPALPGIDESIAPAPLPGIDRIHTPTGAPDTDRTSHRVGLPGADESVSQAPLSGTERMSNPPVAPDVDEPIGRGPRSGTARTHAPNTGPRVDESVAQSSLPSTDRIQTPAVVSSNDEPVTRAPLRGTERFSDPPAVPGVDESVARAPTPETNEPAYATSKEGIAHALTGDSVPVDADEPIADSLLHSIRTVMPKSLRRVVDRTIRASLRRTLATARRRRQTSLPHTQRLLRPISDGRLSHKQASLQSRLVRGMRSARVHAVDAVLRAIAGTHPKRRLLRLLRERGTTVHYASTWRIVPTAKASSISFRERLRWAASTRHARERLAVMAQHALGLASPVAPQATTGVRSRRSPTRPLPQLPAMRPGPLRRLRLWTRARATTHKGLTRRLANHLLRLPSALKRTIHETLLQRQRQMIAAARSPRAAGSPTVRRFTHSTTPTTGAGSSELHIRLARGARAAGVHAKIGILQAIAGTLTRREVLRVLRERIVPARHDASKRAAAVWRITQKAPVSGLSLHEALHKAAAIRGMRADLAETARLALAVERRSRRLRQTRKLTPESTLEVSETALEVSEIALEDSETALAVSETTLAVSETALAVSETTLAVSETALEVSETALAVSETTLAVSETTLAVSETTLAVSETTLAVSETTLAVSETALPLSEPTLESSETALPLSEPTLESSETALQLSEPTPQFPTVTGTFPKPTRKHPESNPKHPESTFARPARRWRIRPATPDAHHTPSTVPDPATFSDGLTTGLGGVFYLINLMLRLDLPGSFEDDWGLATGAGAWGLLDALARGLLALDAHYPTNDALWALLAVLDGRDHQDPTDLPGKQLRGADEFRLPPAWLDQFDPPDTYRWTTVTNRLHIWSSHGFPVADLPFTGLDPEAHARTFIPDGANLMPGTRLPTARLRGPLLKGLNPAMARWLSLTLPYIRHHLHETLGLTRPRQSIAGAMLKLPARVYATPTHIDVVLSLEDISIPVRMAGLDVNPGWLPDFGRIIYFHFQ